MPRGVRKSTLEKLQEELQSTQEIIGKYMTELIALEERKGEIEEKIKLEEFKEVSTILEDKNLSISELKDMLINK